MVLSVLAFSRGLTSAFILYLLLDVVVLSLLAKTSALSLLIEGKAKRKYLNIKLNDQINRRSVAVKILALSALPLIIPADPCHAAAAEGAASYAFKSPSGGRPFAPTSALLPVTRLKLVVDQMYGLSTKLSENNKNQSVFQTLEEMKRLWTSVSKPALFRSEQPSSKVGGQGSSSPIVTQFTTGVSSANKQQYQANRKGLSVPDRISAMLNQADVERQWSMLKYAESKREQDDFVRAAFNFYSNQLEFDGSAYLLTASSEDRKRMIRNNALPSLAAVIAADLDVRDLLRNEFLTAWEDVGAELDFQLKQAADKKIMATADIVELMETAHASIYQWFDLIAPVDVQEAMAVVQNETEIAVK